MKIIGAFVLPSIIVFTVVFGFIRGIKVFDCFIEGAKEGLITVSHILPSIVGLVMSISMLQNSGALDVIVNVLSPIAEKTGIPKEIMPLTVLNPISGGGALSLYENLLTKFGPDSFIGRVSSVMMGSTETTFYAITVYYGSVGIKKTRHTLISGLLADFTSFFMSAFIVRLIFGE